MAKRATSLSDFEDKTPLIFSKEDIKEGVQDFIKKFGTFSRTGLHRFYEQAGIAEVTWQRKMEDGTVEDLKYGKIVRVFDTNSKGQKIWKGYEAKTDLAFDFWEEFYRQAHKLISKEEWVERQKMKQLQETANQIGVI